MFYALKIYHAGLQILACARKKTPSGLSDGVFVWQ
jgi:hypothetical protein